MSQPSPVQRRTSHQVVVIVYQKDRKIQSRIVLRFFLTHFRYKVFDFDPANKKTNQIGTIRLFEHWGELEMVE